MKKIIIDTDGGHDDVLAIYLLLTSRQVDVKAITTVAGNSVISKATRNCYFALNLLGIDLSIYSGADSPLEKELVTAVVHGESGLDGAETNDTDFELSGDGVEKIIEIVNKNPGEIDILTLGPVTNVALALEKDPSIEEKIKSIVIMGGAIDVPGNQNRVAEYNMFVDPDAADIVFRSKVPKVLVPLDPCNEIIISREELDDLNNSPLNESIRDMMEPFIQNIKSHLGVEGALVYDALAGYYLLNPDAYELETMDIVVEAIGKHTRGMTVAEKRLVADRQNNIDVVREIDGKSFRKDLFSYLNNYS